MKNLKVPFLWTLVFLVALVPVTIYNLIETECIQHNVPMTSEQKGLLIGISLAATISIVILLTVIKNHKDEY